MSSKQTSKSASKHGREEAARERISKRYEQLDQQLDELESKRSDLGIEQERGSVSICKASVITLLQASEFPASELVTGICTFRPAFVKNSRADPSSFSQCHRLFGLSYPIH